VNRSMKLIMIVEDDVEINEILKETLELASYKTISASNGKEALAILNKTKWLPDLILLDLMMPVMNGWEFAAAAKQNRKFASIPILVISAFIDNATFVDSVGYLEKPIILSQLLSVVESHLHEGEHAQRL
jgi:CheY-like chemotaxis protein